MHGASVFRLFVIMERFSAVAKSWNTVAIVGVGMIGGSIGRGLLKRRLADRVVGIGRNPQRLRSAELASAVTETTTDLAAGVAQAELTIVCTPVATITDFVRTVSKHCPPDGLITDAGSTKQEIVQALERDPPIPQFVGSHPLAGSEKAGVEHADADLLEDRLVIVTPSESTPDAARQRIHSLWTSLGAHVRDMSPADHDRAVAAISHVPHAVASVLAAATPESFLSLAATGWLDTTRVASGDADLWRQILMQNQACVLNSLRDFEKVLASFTTALEQGDEEAILKLLTAGKQRRDALAD